LKALCKPDWECDPIFGILGNSGSECQSFGCNKPQIFGQKALRSLYIRPSKTGCPFSRPHRMFITLSSLKMINPAFGGTDPIYTVLNSNFMQRQGEFRLKLYALVTDNRCGSCFTYVFIFLIHFEEVLSWKMKSAKVKKDSFPPSY
jgi:hypothetical protein